MQEALKSLINNTSNLLEEIIPVLNRNIQMLQTDVSPESRTLQFLLQQEIENQEKLMQRTRELQETINRYLNPEPIEYPSTRPIGDITIIMSDGEEICHQQVSQTFAEAIEKIGTERVKILDIESRNIPLISTFKHPVYNQISSGNYYIMTNTNTDEKITQLTEIKERLNLNIEVIDNRK